MWWSLLTWQKHVSFFFVTFFFFLELFKIEKTYFINYNLQTRKQKNKQTNKQNVLPPTLPIPLVTENHLLFFSPPPLRLKVWIKSGNMSKCLGLENIFNLLPFSLVHSMFFSLFIECFSSMFLTFMISVIENFIINGSDLLEW